MVPANRSPSHPSPDVEAIEQQLLQSLWAILMMLVDEHAQTSAARREADGALFLRPDQRRRLH